MKTLYLSPSEVDIAGRLIAGGKLVAFPTETVYGLGANALDGAAVRRIFEAKERPVDNPLIAHVAEPEDARALCTSFPPIAEALSDAFWPGPLTMVLPKAACIPDEVSAGLDTVGIRCPSHPVARALIRAAGVPIAAPSANRSGRPSPSAAAHVAEDMDGRIEALIDGGACAVGVESTVVSVTEDCVRILRPGGVSYEMLCALLGEQFVVVDEGVNAPATEKPRSPGMKYRHYAPRAPLTLYAGDPEACAAAMRAAIAAEPGVKWGVLCYDGFEGGFGCPVLTFGAAGDYEAQAQRVFDALRRFDSLPVERILGHCPPDVGVGLAVANRLKRAAGFNVVAVG